MQVTETLKEGLKRAYTITVTAAELDAKVQEKLVEAQPDIEMKGFRKGKVPLAMLRKQFGPRLLGDAMQDAIDGAMRDHLETSGDRPAMQPEVRMVDGETWQEGTDVVVEMKYEALPEIPEIETSKVTLERLVVKADEAAVDEALKNLAESAQNFDDRRKGSKAKDGDQIVIDFKGSVDGELFEGGSAEDYPLVLGSGSFIPGFEEQLVGAKVEDEVTVKVTFPTEYGAKHLAGKEAEFACTVKAVKAPKPAEIDDELAKKYGAEDLAALKAQIAERLEAEYKGASRAVLKRALLDQLDTMVSFELPSKLVEAEAHQIAHQLWHEEHPEEHGHNHGTIEPTDEHKALAERRVRLGLLLAEIGRKAEVTVTDAEMTQAVLAQARQYPGQERAYFEFVQKNPQIQQQLRAPIFEDKVVDLILEGATVTEKEVGKDDLQKAIEALDEM
ncbi:trigger factor [Cereibacter azotoformans]|uniref:Trigger factor n=2 Tax=Cereibacter TaxID=1653176 RepID=TIG_CERS5|nr:trigger factor [Cereibacter azotoformans]A4WS82.1 RecName: Full=Trigger factor; Short=TF; AltName: Full=PPIase [Cereibacter sphaeroides ATCC 17025]AXQ93432.1 trigger factor [Cereibacter sphaeroides]MBO4168811.1 trigger factor [Cereibacter azotoformans]PTR13544.1 trigger factor [Cereibacter azotoformans]UIJ31764.1 trigger factor [Cereibacter azotoformans]ULB09550.1 trigger factor [Cereibacter azotoformans]